MKKTFKAWWNKLRRRRVDPNPVSADIVHSPSPSVQTAQTAQPKQPDNTVGKSRSKRAALDTGWRSLEGFRGRRTLADAINDLNRVVADHHGQSAGKTPVLAADSAIHTLTFQDLVQKLQDEQQDRDATISSQVRGFFGKLEPVTRLTLNAAGGLASAAGAPPGVGVATGGLTVLLDLALAPEANTELIMSTLDQVQRDTNFTRTLADPDLTIAEDVQDAVVEFMIDLIGFLRISIGFLQGYMSKFAKLALGLADVKGAVKAVDDRRKVVDREVSRLVEALILQSQQMMVHADAMSPLGSLTYLDIHKTARKVRVPGSGQWFEIEFKKWMNDDSMPMLLCHGAGGAGKTCLASLAVDCIGASDLGLNVGIASVYCHYTRFAEQTKPAILGSIVKQLIANRPSLAKGVDLAGADSQYCDWPGLLADIVARFDQVYLVFDGLDEASSNVDDEIEIAKLLAQVRDDPKVRSNRLRLAMFLRSSHSFEKQLKPYHSIRVSASKEDVRLLLLKKVHAVSRFKQWAEHDAAAKDDAAFVDTLLEHIYEASHGIFELADRQITDILRSQTEYDALNAASLASSYVGDYYRRDLERVKQQSHPHALKLMNWLAYTTRACYWHELRVALAISGAPDSPKTLDKMCITEPEALVNSCEGLVEIIDPDQPVPQYSDKTSLPDLKTLLRGPQIRLSHRLVSEFLERERDQLLPDGRDFIFKQCLRIICSPAMAKTVQDMFFQPMKEAVLQRLLADPKSPGSKAKAFLVWAFGSWGHYCGYELDVEERALLRKFDDHFARDPVYNLSVLHLCAMMGFDRAAHVLRSDGFPLRRSKKGESG